METSQVKGIALGTVKDTFEETVKGPILLHHIQAITKKVNTDAHIADHRIGFVAYIFQNKNSIRKNEYKKSGSLSCDEKRIPGYKRNAAPSNVANNHFFFFFSTDDNL